MRQYLARVHCVGSHWLVYVPAVELWASVREKQQIKAVAVQLTKAATGVAGEVDLQEGRVLATDQDFLREHMYARRWSEVAHV